MWAHACSCRLIYSKQNSWLIPTGGTVRNREMFILIYHEKKASDVCSNGNNTLLAHKKLSYGCTTCVVIRPLFFRPCLLFKLLDYPVSYVNSFGAGVVCFSLQQNWTTEAGFKSSKRYHIFFSEVFICIEAKDWPTQKKASLLPSDLLFLNRI